MKKIRKALFIALLVSLALVFVGCSNPKSLAKQTYDLTQQATSISDPSKAIKLATKAAKIAAQVEKLSEAKQEEYETELARLMGY
jgi:cell division protein FtsB